MNFRITILASLLLLISSAAIAEDRPNILWISCEDISPNLGCYEDEYASTPNLDNLAKQGVRYTNAFTHAGVCAVLRSGVITGVYPISIGSQHMRSNIVPPPHIKCFPEYLREIGYYCTNRSKTDYQFQPPATTWDRQGGGHNDWRGREKGQPFFSVINLTICHESQIRHGEGRHRQITNKLKTEQIHDPELAGKYLPKYIPNTPAARKNWAWYHDNISEMDRQVGEILQKLDDDGLTENTLVIFWSDHGQGMPRGKRWIYDSGTHVPVIMRWPGKLAKDSVSKELMTLLDLTKTTLKVANAKTPDYLHGRNLLGDAKEPEPEYVFFHRDRMDEAYDLMRGARNKKFRYIRNYEPEKSYAQGIDYMDKMPALIEWRRLHKEGKLSDIQSHFFDVPKPLEELYEIGKDPFEVNNLAGDPAYAETLKKMREATEKWQEEVGDLGMIPEPILMSRMRPNGMQKTDKPVIKVISDSDKIVCEIKCATDGNSIAYAISNSVASKQDQKNEGRANKGKKRQVSWKLYTQPLKLKKGDVLMTKACRIGFRDSPVVRKKIE